jgi:hypothetical protein
LRDHLLAAERRAGSIAMLHHKCPPSMRYLWVWFLELCKGRPAGMSSPSPLPSAEIAAWAALGGFLPTPWELGVLRQLDAAFCAGGKGSHGR